jgi:hypothetical protein
MKVEIITCDNCGATIDPRSKWVRISELSQDWCQSCREGSFVDLVDTDVYLWPKRMTLDTVKHILAVRDAHIQGLGAAIKSVKDERDRARHELRRARNQAADAYASSNRPAEALKDIATNARRS